MRLKGNMVIELVDGNTGEDERIEEGNMVTNAVNDILGLNPMGIFYAVAGEYDTHLLWNDKLLPICPNMVGGILLYSEPLEEDADNIYPSTVKLPVAYAGNDVNATANVARGSLNLTESRALEDGYKFVWEFTPSQGNGTIAAVALTSALGGKNAYGSMDSSATAFLQVMETKLETQTKEELAELYSAVEVDFGNNLMYSLTFAEQSVVVKKKRLPVFTVGLNDRLDDTTCTLLEETAIPCSTFKFQGSYTPYGDFLDGHDGYWYGFSNSGNSSGNATVYWVKIKKDGLSMAEGVWTLSNVCIRALGSFKVDTYVERSSRGVIRGGYLYTPAYDNTGIYKINLGNVADVTLIPFGFTSAGKSQTGSGTCSNYLLMVNDLIIGWDFQVKPDDTVVQTAGGARFPNVATPLFQYKEFLFGWGGNYGSDYRMAYLVMPYLASINNLGSAVVKNTDKTMKKKNSETEGFDMKEFWNTVQLIFAAVGGWLGWFLGGCDGLLYALVAFVVVDYITGVMCAAADKELSSEVGFRGIAKKVLIFLLVGVANIIDVQVIGSGSVLRTAVIFFYLSNEGVSLLENAAHLGLPVPEKLKDILEQLHDRAENGKGDE